MSHDGPPDPTPGPFVILKKEKIPLATLVISGKKFLRNSIRVNQKIKEKKNCIVNFLCVHFWAASISLGREEVNRAGIELTTEYVIIYILVPNGMTSRSEMEEEEKGKG
jgi:hypothetical protein